MLKSDGNLLLGLLDFGEHVPICIQEVSVWLSSLVGKGRRPQRHPKDTWSFVVDIMPVQSQLTRAMAAQQREGWSPITT